MYWTTFLRRGRISAGVFLIFISILLTPIPALAQPFVYVKSFGSVGSGPGKFQQVSDLDQDSHGHYVVLDGYLGKFQICSSTGVCTEHDTAARIADQYGNQLGLAVNSKDEIFITNLFGDVEKCTHDGVCEGFIGEYDGTFISSWGIAIDPQDRVYIADTNFGRIIVCDSGGSCSAFGSYGSEVGQFNSPSGLAINAQGKVVIADAGNERVQICDHLGNCELSGYSNPDFFSSGSYGQGLALLPSSTMFMTGYGVAQIYSCTSRGVCRTVALSNYNNPGFLQSPQGIMVDDAGQLVIGDYGKVHFMAPNVTINPGIADAWIEAGLSGQGLLVSVFENIPLVFIAWFTYETTRPAGFPPPVIGEWGHRWVTLQGGYSGNVANLDIYLTQGGVFESPTPSPASAEKIGTATLTLNSCYSATLVYNITSTGLQGTKHLSRVVNDNVSNCEILSGGN